MPIHRTSFALTLAAVLGASPAAGQVEFSDTQLYFELNATDRDVGLHGRLDGPSWGNAKILGPGGTFHVIKAFSNTDSPEFGMTELFFESNEPPIAERSFAELLMLFPAGTYSFMGTTRDGQPMSGSDELTADMPCPPTLFNAVHAGDDVVLRWRLEPGSFDPDTEECDGDDVEVESIEVVVELEDTASEETRSLTMALSPDVRRLEIPEEILDGLDPETTDAKFEVLVIEESGNRTASEREFEL